MNKCKLSRKRRKVALIQKRLDDNDFPKPKSKDFGYNNGITRISVDWVEEKIDDFITFLNQDKKRFKNLDKAKYDFLNNLVTRSINNCRKT